MKIWSPKQLPDLPNMQLAVVGHVEWITFLNVDKLPEPGMICHADSFFEEPAGGGAVAAIQMARIIKKPVHLFTSLGKDQIGEMSYKRLIELGLNVSVAWKDKPTRRGISLVDSSGERAITVIGERLEPLGNENLPWDVLSSYKGVFVTAGDPLSLRLCREAKIMTATPRVGIDVLNNSGIKLDGLIGSGLDPGEIFRKDDLKITPNLMITTEGKKGGIATPGGRYEAYNSQKQIVDSYGCGDTFAAGVTVGLSAGWTHEQATSLGAHYGSLCAEHKGPYKR